MPKVEATPSVLMEIGDHVYMGDLKTLHIRRYKSGVNSGKLFVEYTLKEGDVPFNHSTLERRSVVSNLIKRAAHALQEGKQIELRVQKLSAIEERYAHILAIKEA